MLANKKYEKMTPAKKKKKKKKINSAVGQAARIMLFKQNPKHINRYTRHILDNYDKYSKED